MEQTNNADPWLECCCYFLYSQIYKFFGFGFSRTINEGAVEQFAMDDGFKSYTNNDQCGSGCDCFYEIGGL